MTRPVLRCALCLWACTVAVALLFFLRGCWQGGPMVTVRVDVPTLTFQEK